MGPLLGMAGLAEASEAFALMQGYAWLLVIGLTAAIGFFARSLIAAAISLILVVFATFLFEPWRAFQPFESNDPDFHSLMSLWRGFAWVWGFTVAGAIAAAIRPLAFPASSTEGTPQIESMEFSTLPKFPGTAQ